MHGWLFHALAAVTLLCQAAFPQLLTCFFSFLLCVCVLQALQ